MSLTYAEMFWIRTVFRGAGFGHRFISNPPDRALMFKAYLMHLARSARARHERNLRNS